MAFPSPKKPLSLGLVGFMCVILLVVVDKARSREVFFEFARFDEGDTDLYSEGAVSISSNFALQLTRVDADGKPAPSSIGRTFCGFPVPLYDNSTGKVASLFTSFVLNMTAPNDTATPADGMAFIIGPYASKPANAAGGFLGLSSNTTAQNHTANYVAVEFDTYPNQDIGDPNFMHIGIDVNSVNSSATVEWELQSGQPLTVVVTYDPFDKKLSVFAFYPNGKRFSLSYDIDLRTVLPANVLTGFSASTGKYSQINQVNSWYLSSIIGDTNDCVEEDRGGDM